MRPRSMSPMPRWAIPCRGDWNDVSWDGDDSLPARLSLSFGHGAELLQVGIDDKKAFSVGIAKLTLY